MAICSTTVIQVWLDYKYNGFDGFAYKLMILQYILKEQGKCAKTSLVSKSSGEVQRCAQDFDTIAACITRAVSTDDVTKSSSSSQERSDEEKNASSVDQLKRITFQALNNILERG